MKKFITGALALLATASISQAEIDSPTLSGSLTISLTKNYEEGGYPSNENTYISVLTDTDTTYRYQYKSVSKTAKVTNTEFIQGLIDVGYLDEESSASDWSLILVEDEYFGCAFNSYVSVFAVSSEYGAVYVGNADSYFYEYNYDFPFVASYVSDSIDAESSLYTDTYDPENDYQTIKEVGKGRVKGKELLSIIIGLPYTYFDGEDSYTGLSPVMMFGLNSYSYSFSYTDDYINETYTSSYTPSTSTISGLLGGDGLFDGPSRSESGSIYTGSLKVGSLREVTDEGLLEELYYAISSAYEYDIRLE